MENNENKVIEGNENTENINRTDKRIKDLSQKVELTAKERDDLADSKKKLEIERDTISKERDFYASFSDLASKYTAAPEYKAQIMEKVKLGYTAEDATVSVLAKEGKLNSTQQIQRESPIGGSSTNAITGNGKKSIGEMTRDEKRQALIDAEARGEISVQ